LILLVLATAGLSKDHLAAVFTKQFFPYAVAIWAATLRGARVTGHPVSLSSRFRLTFYFA
jgi:hypothetical protein